MTTLLGPIPPTRGRRGCRRDVPYRTSPRGAPAARRRDARPSQHDRPGDDRETPGRGCLDPHHAHGVRRPGIPRRGPRLRGDARGGQDPAPAKIAPGIVTLLVLEDAADSIVAACFPMTSNRRGGWHRLAVRRATVWSTTSNSAAVRSLGSSARPAETCRSKPACSTTSKIVAGRPAAAPGERARTRPTLTLP